MPLIQVIVGSTRPGRFSEKPVAWLQDRLGRRDDFDLEILDLRDYPLPFYDQAVPPARSLRDYTDKNVARLGRAIERGLTDSSSSPASTTMATRLHSRTRWTACSRNSTQTGDVRRLRQCRRRPGDRAAAPGGSRIRNGSPSPRRPHSSGADDRRQASRSVYSRRVQLIGPTSRQSGLGSPVVDCCAGRWTSTPGSILKRRFPVGPKAVDHRAPMRSTTRFASAVTRRSVSPLAGSAASLDTFDRMTVQASQP